MRITGIAAVWVCLFGGAVSAQQPDKKLSPAARELIAAFDAEIASGEELSEELRERMKRALAEEDLKLRRVAVELFTKCDEPDFVVPALSAALDDVVAKIGKFVIRCVYEKNPDMTTFSSLKGFESELFVGGVFHAREIIEGLGAIRDPAAEEALCRFLKNHRPDKTSFNVLWAACEELANYGTVKSLKAAIGSFKWVEAYALAPASRKPKRVVTRHNSALNVFGNIARLATGSDAAKIHESLAAAFREIGADETPEWRGKKTAGAWSRLLSKYKRDLPKSLPARDS